MPHGDDDTWVQTYTGKRFYPLDPRVEDVDIQDIAHALSLKCRYTGHCREFYSIAQHSVLVAEIVDKFGRRQQTLTALMHDAAEAYIADVARPVKASILQLKEIEERLEVVIAEKFGLIFPFPDAVKTADNIMLATERRDLMGTPPRPWKTYGVEPLASKVVPYDWRWARSVFLEEFKRLVA